MKQDMDNPETCVCQFAVRLRTRVSEGLNTLSDRAILSKSHDHHRNTPPQNLHNPGAPPIGIPVAHCATKMTERQPRNHARDHTRDHSRGRIRPRTDPIEQQCELTAREVKFADDAHGEGLEGVSMRDRPYEHGSALYRAESKGSGKRHNSFNASVPTPHHHSRAPTISSHHPESESSEEEEDEPFEEKGGHSSSRRSIHAHHAAQSSEHYYSPRCAQPLPPPAGRREKRVSQHVTPSSVPMLPLSTTTALPPPPKESTDIDHVRHELKLIRKDIEACTKAIKVQAQAVDHLANAMSKLATAQAMDSVSTSVARLTRELHNMGYAPSVDQGGERMRCSGGNMRGSSSAGGYREQHL